MATDENEELVEALNHIVWVAYCGIDGRDENGVYRNFSEQERDQMVEIAVKALVKVGKLSDNMKDATRYLRKPETTPIRVTNSDM